MTNNFSFQISSISEPQAVQCIEGSLYFFREPWSGQFFSRETWFKFLFIRDSWSPHSRNFYVHVKAVLELSVTRERTFELNVICEL